MSDLYIFDPYDKLLAILSNEAEGACPFWNAPFKEDLNKGSSFSFTVPADQEDAQYIVAENQVAFKDKDGDFRLFVIREPEETDGEDGPEINAVCEPAMLELNDEVITDKRPYNTTALAALTSYLTGTRWQVGTVADLGLNSSNAYYEAVTDAITDVINIWGGELKDRITVDETGIIGRYIDILARRGADIGKVWEMDKDILSFSHKVQSYPKTALYGRGSSLDTDDGGFTRKITFADVVWSRANGDPVDKPAGQEWVGDPDALNIYGRPNADGSLRHRFGIFEDSEETEPAALLQKTWDSLQDQKNPVENFEMDVFLLGELIGYEHEKVRLGDTTFAINRNFAKPIKVEERVISFEYDVSDPDNSGTVELGDYIDLFTDDERLDNMEATLNNKSGIWDQGSGPVTDSDFPDTVPPVPTGFTANGLFKIIQLIWDYDSSSYIAAYEVYASQVAGFTPDASNLVFRGKVGAYNHEADTDQQWYFRLRAINTHGTASDFTAEVSAQTVQISTKDIAPLTITNELIAEDAEIDFAKIGNVIITGGMINVTSLSAITANLGTVTAGTLTGVTINGSTFNATYKGGSSTQYGHTALDSNSLNFYEDADTGGAAYSEIYANMNFTIKGIDYDLERPGIGYYRYTINDDGIVYDGQGDQMFGGFSLTRDNNTGNTTFKVTQGIMTIDTKGGAISNSYFNKKGQYAWSATDTPRSFSGSLQSSFSSSTKGWPGGYGLVHWFGSLSSGEDGAGFQIWVPYRTNIDGTPAGDGNLMFRTGRYSNAGWTNWRQFVSTNSSGRIDQTMTFDGTHYLETNAIDHNGSGLHLYVRPMSGGMVAATVKGTTDQFVPVKASSFPTGSLADYKQDITPWTETEAIDLIKNAVLYKYKLKVDIAAGIDFVRHGFVIGDGYNTPQMVIDPEGDAVEQYAMNSLSIKAIQEIITKVDDHESRIAALEQKLEVA